MLPLNHKRTTSSLAPSKFCEAKNSNRKIEGSTLKIKSSNLHITKQAENSYSLIIFSTERFRDLGKLNFKMVVWF